MSKTKYVHLKGRADIRMTPEGKIALYLYDPLTQETIINPTNPIVFTHIPSEGLPLMFLNIDMIAEFGVNSFNLHLPTLEQIYCGITWEKAEDPEAGTIDVMNSTDPPD
ncbi:hypothetical protein [Dyadobacter sp. CY323]|uniref:hypothetical protein n=1 Tax=Dyadobacter sp. CY323 TaxID=2907302 RepID=UPI001F44F0F9|nr:hypothetical protein [Dyadobacter sp. CY323]MCE6989808.1 hypothetical protein [Dyadobacter sp. CY323]